MKPLIFVGDPFSLSGYSEHCRELILELVAMGSDISIHHKPQDPTAYNGPGIDKLKPLVDKQNGSDILVCVTTPYCLKPGPERKVLVTFFETDSLPKEWVHNINSMVDVVIVSTNFNKETFTKAGVTRPIYVVPGGYDEKIYNTTVPSNFYNFDDDTFVFFAMSSWQSRKAWDRLLIAYWTEFKPTEKVALVAKVYPPSSEQDTFVINRDVLGIKRILGVNNFQDRKIKESVPFYVMRHNLPPTELAKMYASADAYVSATHGEGFNRGAMHAAACGLPIVVTGWSGHLDFLNPDNAYLCDYTLSPCLVNQGNSNYTPNMLWADVSIMSLRQQMRKVYEERDNPKKAIVSPYYHWSNVAKIFQDTINTHYGE